MELTPAHEIRQRVERLQAHLQAEGLDGALLHGMTNLFYYSGTAQQAHLWVPAHGAAVLLVRRVLERARHESALPRVEAMASLRQLPDYVGAAKRIGMELDILPVSLFQLYQKSLPGLEIIDLGAYTRLARSVKSEYEIEQVRGAARIADATFRDLVAALTEGQTELELSAIAEGAARRHGFQGMLRWRAQVGFECPAVHLLVGESALAFGFGDTVFGGEGLTPAVPYGAGLRKVIRDVPVCFDHPTAHNGYIHDQTRTLCLGQLDAELQRAYAACQEIHARFTSDARPGVTGEELWDAAVAIAEQAGLVEHYMGYGGNGARFVGHGVGLELDEWPVLAPKVRQPVAVGNVIAVEPTFFFPGKGAVKLENTYAIHANRVELLTLTPGEISYK